MTCQDTETGINDVIKPTPETTVKCLLARNTETTFRAELLSTTFLLLQIQVTCYLYIRSYNCLCKLSLLVPTYFPDDGILLLYLVGRKAFSVLERVVRLGA